MNGCPSLITSSGALVLRGRLPGAITFASPGSRLNWPMRLPSPKPHPGIMGVKVWPSLSVREKRLPSPSMTFRDEVSMEPSGPSPSPLAITKLIGAPSATAAIAAGSPHGGMS